MLFYYGNNPYNTPAMLPLGNPECDMLPEVEISIVDSVFDSVKIILNVTVWYSSESTRVYKNVITKKCLFQ